MREIFGFMALLQLMQMNSWVESKMEDVFSSTAELANLHSGNRLTKTKII